MQINNERGVPQHTSSLVDLVQPEELSRLTAGQVTSNNQAGLDEILENLSDGMPDMYPQSKTRLNQGGTTDEQPLYDRSLM